MKKPEVIYRVRSNKFPPEEPSSCEEVTSQVCPKCSGKGFLRDRRTDCDLCGATGYAPPYKIAIWKDAQKNAKA